MAAATGLETARPGPRAGRWLAWSTGTIRATRPRGRIVVDAGAAKVLRERGSSLLPVGITEVEGDFSAGDAVEIASDGVVIGKGIANHSAAELDRARGKRSGEVTELPPGRGEEAVHRDNFVLT